MQKRIFPCGSDGKESACNAGDAGPIPRLGRSPGEGNGNLLQYSCLENLIDRGTWWATSPWGRKESVTTEHADAKIKKQGSAHASCTRHSRGRTAHLSRPSSGPSPRPVQGPSPAPGGVRSKGTCCFSPSPVLKQGPEKVLPKFLVQLLSVFFLLIY